MYLFCCGCCCVVYIESMWVFAGNRGYLKCVNSGKSMHKESMDKDSGRGVKERDTVIPVGYPLHWDDSGVPILLSSQDMRRRDKRRKLLAQPRSPKVKTAHWQQDRPQRVRVETTERQRTRGLLGVLTESVWFSLPSTEQVKQDG